LRTGLAHLIVNRVDPRRILLMTFSRRAAAEMTRRAGRICSQVIGTNGDVMTEALTWAGTFHAIGARLLREYAEQIGIDPAFTIHDREDSADLMNLVRHELGFSKMETRFPTKASCLAIYSRAVNAELPLNEVLRGSFPWCAEWEPQLRELFAAYVEAKQTQNVLDYDDLLLYGPKPPAIRCLRRTWAGDSTTCWSMNTRTPTGSSPPFSWP
jgi:DNA helicase-2/ATP-dependent DNA helicase PcrA